MPEGQGYSEFFICTIPSGMAISGTVTDALGTHPIIGAFLFVLSIPNQMLQAKILDKLDDFVMGILMPTYFVVCGLRTNFGEMDSIYEIVGYLILFVSATILSSVAATFFSDMSIKEGLVVGALSTQLYSLMVGGILVMTAMVTPITMLYRPSQELSPHKRRTIQKAKLEEELRVLACIYGTHGIPSVINLLGLSNSTPASPITVFALQVVELVGRASSMLEVHNSDKRGSRSLGQEETQTRQIITAFDNYELRSDGVMLQVLTARSALSAMDEDICNIAKDKRVAFIILPFHKQRSIEGKMKDVNPEIRAVNEVTSEFDSTFSVLVMQQYVKPIGDGSINSYGSMSERIEGIGMDMDLDMQRADSEAGDVFSSFRRRPEPMPRV
ncbi:hypothetical protein K7X08_006911 [Anisodus acutangulus]|uniref:Cation/H+ exchanger domain-containing protein n=1 Tax=Anisodus acutangulus TaxID=402998 RepID=A0A9Q1LEM3_9SOLA|nr:hypothetical protein K7X08_006911 [Anisodus acutangulus]